MRICIVDDNVRLNQGLKASFQEKGYAVDCFTDSVEAEKYLLLNHVDYDAIILDWMMPGKTGVELCKALRAGNVSTPILNAYGCGRP